MIRASSSPMLMIAMQRSADLHEGGMWHSRFRASLQPLRWCSRLRRSTRPVPQGRWACCCCSCAALYPHGTGACAGFYSLRTAPRMTASPVWSVPQARPSRNSWFDAGLMHAHATLLSWCRGVGRLNMGNTRCQPCLVLVPIVTWHLLSTPEHVPFMLIPAPCAEPRHIVRPK